MSLLSDVSETEKQSASQSICANRCYSPGNYCRHPGLRAYLQCSCHWVQWNLDFFGWRKLNIPTGMLRIGQTQQLPPFFAQNFKLHLLDTYTLSAIPLCLAVQFIDSVWSESYFCWKGSNKSLPMQMKIVRKLYNLWTGQSHNLSKKIGKGKGNYPMCCLVSWQANQATQLPSSFSVLSPWEDTNLSFFFPMPFFLPYWNSILLKSLLTLSHLAETTYQTPQLPTELYEKVEAWTKSKTLTILWNQVQKCFFFFSINFRVIRTNMQILCPDRMYNLKNELILQIALFHFFVIFQAVYSNDSGICFLVLQQLLHCFFVFPVAFLN